MAGGNSKKTYLLLDYDGPINHEEENTPIIKTPTYYKNFEKKLLSHYQNRGSLEEKADIAADMCKNYALYASKPESLLFTLNILHSCGITVINGSQRSIVKDDPNYGDYAHAQQEGMDIFFGEQRPFLKKEDTDKIRDTTLKIAAEFKKLLDKNNYEVKYDSSKRSNVIITKDGEKISLKDKRISDLMRQAAKNVNDKTQPLDEDTAIKYLDETKLPLALACELMGVGTLDQGVLKDDKILYSQPDLVDFIHAPRKKVYKDLELVDEKYHQDFDRYVDTHHNIETILQFVPLDVLIEKAVDDDIKNDKFAHQIMQDIARYCTEFPDKVKQWQERAGASPETVEKYTKEGSPLYKDYLIRRKQRGLSNKIPKAKAEQTLANDHLKDFIDYKANTLLNTKEVSNILNELAEDKKHHELNVLIENKVIDIINHKASELLNKKGLNEILSELAKDKEDRQLNNPSDNKVIEFIDYKARELLKTKELHDILNELAQDTEHRELNDLIANRINELLKSDLSNDEIFDNNIVRMNAFINSTVDKDMFLTHYHIKCEINNMINIMSDHAKELEDNPYLKNIVLDDKQQLVNLNNKLDNNPIHTKGVASKFSKVTEEHMNNYKAEIKGKTVPEKCSYYLNTIKDRFSNFKNWLSSKFSQDHNKSEKSILQKQKKHYQSVASMHSSAKARISKNEPEVENDNTSKHRMK